MDIQDIRRAVLKALIKQRHGGVARQFALMVKKPDGQINDMLSVPPRKSFGERIARSLEKSYLPSPLPSGYLDDIKNADEIVYPTGDTSNAEAQQNTAAVLYGQFNSSIAEVISMMEAMNDTEQREVVGAVKMLYSQSAKARENPDQRAVQ